MRFPDVSEIGKVEIEGAGTFHVLMVRDGWRVIVAEQKPTENPANQVEALAEAWHRYLVATAPGALSAEQLTDDAGGILAALTATGWYLLRADEVERLRSGGAS